MESNPIWKFLTKFAMVGNPFVVVERCHVISFNFKLFLKTSLPTRPNCELPNIEE